MIFFTRTLCQGIQPKSGWEQPAYHQWRRRVKVYADYLTAIGPMLPASVKRLCRASLHDARVVAAEQKPGVLILVLDASNALSRFRGQCVRLRFHGVEKRLPLRGLAGQWWLYEEAHLSSRACFSLHVLFDMSELEIEANELVIELLGRRKPIFSMVPRELRQYPIWEFALDQEAVEGQDETWIRPVKRKTVPKNAHSQIVATQFTTHAGKELHGFMVVTTVGGHVEIQPGAVFWMGYRSLSGGSKERVAKTRPKSSTKDRNELARVLAVGEGEVFPMCYRLKVAVSGEKTLRQGQIV